MPDFTIGQPVTTDVPNVEVSVTPQRPLAPGRHVFQLVVTDDAGNASEPATVEVVVIGDARPTAVIDAPQRVAAGRSFELSGRRSADLPPGRIVRYTWLQLS